MGKVLLATIFTALFLLWGVSWFISTVKYDISIGDYLKRAGNSNTIELASENLQMAVTEIEKRGWTAGNTGVLWQSPQNDLKFWHDNLSSALDELGNISQDATPLEVSNVLIKLRESLLDGGESTSVTAPDGIELYPNNALFMFWAWGSALLACFFWGWVAIRSY